MTMRNPLPSSIRFRFLDSRRWLAAALLLVSMSAFSQPRVIEVLADKNSHFRIGGQDQPTITLKAGEALLFRIEARKGKNHNRNGAVHGFTMLHAKSRARVPGWDFELKPGMQ